MDPLSYNPIMVPPGMTDVYGVAHSCSHPTKVVRATPESDPKYAKGQVQLKVWESHSTHLVSRRAPQGCLVGGILGEGAERLCV